MDGLEILSFGCRLNSLEGEIIRRAATAAGLEDAVVINTCAVTLEAERQARQAIRRARRARPGARLIVTGCAAQIDPTSFAAMPEVDQVLGNREKLAVAAYATAERVQVGSLAQLGTAPVPSIDVFAGRTRATLEVQQGCDHRCTFCIIPLGRGPSRSVPVAEAVERARHLVERGYRELVLTGVDLTAYGADLPERPSLGDLCRDLLTALPALPRLRLSSLDPVEIDDTLWRLIAEEPRLMPHLHLSLQAGDDLVLKRMKRRHSRAAALATCRRARALRPGIALGADLIAGFPTEDAAMFAQTLALIEEAGLDYVHSFPFSPRPGTPAARMPQVQPEMIHERASSLRQAGDAALSRSLTARIGTTAAVLAERNGKGHSEHYAPVQLPPDLGAVPGEIVRLRLTGLSGRLLASEAA